VFFRAENWSSAIKVLRGMFGFEYIFLPQAFAEKLSWLTEYNIYFKTNFISLSVKNDQFLLASTYVVIIILMAKWMLKQYSFKVTLANSIVNSFMFIVAILFLVRESEFLYFGF